MASFSAGLRCCSICSAVPAACGPSGSEEPQGFCWVWAIRVLAEWDVTRGPVVLSFSIRAVSQPARDDQSPACVQSRDGLQGCRDEESQQCAVKEQRLT